MKICGQCAIEYPDLKDVCVECGNALRPFDPHGPICVGSAGVGSYPKNRMKPEAE